MTDDGSCIGCNGCNCAYDDGCSASLGKDTVRSPAVDAQESSGDSNEEQTSRYADRVQDVHLQVLLSTCGSG